MYIQSLGVYQEEYIGFVMSCEFFGQNYFIQYYSDGFYLQRLVLPLWLLDLLLAISLT